MGLGQRPPSSTGLHGPCREGFSASAAPLPSMRFCAEPPRHAEFVLHVYCCPGTFRLSVPPRGEREQRPSAWVWLEHTSHIPPVCSSAPWATSWHHCRWFPSSCRVEPQGSLASRPREARQTKRHPTACCGWEPAAVWLGERAHAAVPCRLALRLAAGLFGF